MQCSSTHSDPQNRAAGLYAAHYEYSTRCSQSVQPNLELQRQCSPVLELSDCCTDILFGTASCCTVLNCHVQWSRRLLSSLCGTLEQICKLVACCTSSSDAALVPLPRHRHAAPTQLRRRSHATQTPHQPALMPPSRSSHAALCRLHAAPTSPPRRPSAAATPPPRRLHTAATPQQKPPQCHPHAIFKPPLRRPAARSSHAALTLAESFLHAVRTPLAHCRNPSATPPSRSGTLPSRHCVRPSHRRSAALTSHAAFALLLTVPTPSPLPPHFALHNAATQLSRGGTSHRCMQPSHRRRGAGWGGRMSRVGRGGVGGRASMGRLVGMIVQPNGRTSVRSKERAPNRGG